MPPQWSVFSPDEVAPGFRLLRQPVQRLYVCGTLPPKKAKRVTVVGTRTASRQGMQAAFEISRVLAQAGIVVVSGMARGIDTAAHEGALAGGGPTVAFIGSGWDRISPHRARSLAGRISQKGAVVSEYPREFSARPYTFVARNRLLAAYTLGTVVVEAGEKSGALITADFALELGRMVWGVPGDINRSNTGGSNGLIRDGAMVALDGSDILIGLGLTRIYESEFEGEIDRGLTGPQHHIWKTLSREGVLDVESLHRFTNLPVAVLLAGISELEIMGYLGRSPEGLSLKKASKSF